MQVGNRKANKWLLLMFFFLSVAVGYFIGAAMESGSTIMEWNENLNNIMKEPFARFYWTQYSVATIGIMIAVYVFFVLYYITTLKNYMYGKEYGTAQFADIKQLNQKLADLNNDENDPHNIVVLVKRFWN